MEYSKRRQNSEQQSAEIIVHPSVSSSMSLDKALEIFLKAQDAAVHSKETKNDYKIAVRLFLRYVAKESESTTIQQITEADVLGWLAHLRNDGTKYGKPYSTRSIETYFRDVLVFFNWLTSHGCIVVNPLGNIPKPKTDKTLIRVFTEDEIRLLDAACDRVVNEGGGMTEDERKAIGARDRAFLWLLLSTGIRLSEACGLLFSDIDWKEGFIYIRGKGAKERRIPFGKVARQNLNTYIMYWRGGPAGPDDSVFLNLWGRPLRRASGDKIFGRLKRIAKITDKRVSPHTCRHWFAVNCIKNGMPTIVLKEILGHENWDMIEVYVHLAEQDTKVLYDRYSPADGLEMHQSGKGRRAELREWRNARKRSLKGK